MGELFDELLAELDGSDVDEQVKIICDTITEEEIKRIDSYLGPKGANIFLSLPAGSDKKDYFFVCLEREAPESYIVSHWSKKASQLDSPLKRINVWPVDEKNPKKILDSYSKWYKFVKGE